MDFSIVILTNRHDPEALRACLTSVAQSTGVSFEVIVVDTAGDSSILSQVSEVIPKATCILNKEDKGFARAANQALRIAKGKYILFIDPALSFGPETLQRMCMRLDTAPEVGVASLLIRSVNRMREENVCTFPTFLDRMLLAFPMQGVLRRNNLLNNYFMRDVDLSHTQDVNVIMRSFLLLRRAALEITGFFDERWFVSLKEAALCKRMKEKGWKARFFADQEAIRAQEYFVK